MVTAAATLSAELERFLQVPRLVLVTTIDAGSAWPTNNLITWVVAMDGERVRLATETGGRVMTNIQADDRVLLTVMTKGACHTIEGNARLIAGELEGVSLKLSCAELRVRVVRDVTFWGGRLTGEPPYEVTYDPTLNEMLDTSVFAAMRAV